MRLRQIHFYFHQQEKSLIKQNVLQFVDYKGITKYRFYQETGITRGILDQNNGMSEENTSRFLAYYPEVNVEWLITGKGEMLKTKSEEKVIKENDNLKDNLFDNKPNVQKKLSNEEPPYNIVSLPSNRKTKDAVYPIQEIPLYDLEAVAGLKELFSGGKSVTQILDTIRIPHLPKCDGAISITGDSMYPLLKSGDMVLYKEIPLDSIFYGEMYLLAYQIDEWEEYITVKYVQKSELGDDYLKLVSQNQHHQPKDVKKAQITAIAIIKASIRINTMM